MNTVGDLILIVKSRFPLVLVETNEERRILEMIDNACKLEHWACFTWTIADGLRRLGRGAPIPDTTEFRQALRHIDKTAQSGVYVLLDAQPYLVDPVNVRLIKEIAQDFDETARTLVMVSPALDLPQDLKRLAARFVLALPDRGRMRQLIVDEAKRYEAASGKRLRGYMEALDALAEHLAGMCEEDAQRLIRQALHDDGAITFEDVRRALELKHESVGAAGLLEYQVDAGSFADVGGLANLKRWLGVRRAAFSATHAQPAVDVPKGVLLLGVQGSGKSVAAKAVAGTWHLPLLRLDFAVLYNKFQGETERNLRESLKQVEAMAPCVLWIDEIEKGLAADSSGSTDGGLSRRLLGTLLTWMAERKKRVFIVATANDVSQLPPELLRKGRFDEIFFVDLPDTATRAEIFRIHLAKRGLAADGFDVEGLAALTEGYSGAEIEQAIVAGMYEALAKNEPITSGHVRMEIARTRPLSIVMAEHVASLREWAASRTVPAN
ncbi:MAG TPA: AAA family ATPase [Burkholderiales bacterium]|nr:AAA family ATPase [Burkholderiales bacterium]